MPRSPPPRSIFVFRLFIVSLSHHAKRVAQPSVSRLPRPTSAPIPPSDSLAASPSPSTDKASLSLSLPRRTRHPILDTRYLIMLNASGFCGRIMRPRCPRASTLSSPRHLSSLSPTPVVSLPHPCRPFLSTRLTLRAKIRGREPANVRARNAEPCLPHLSTEGLASRRVVDGRGDLLSHRDDRAKGCSDFNASHSVFRSNSQQCRNNGVGTSVLIRR